MSEIKELERKFIIMSRIAAALGRKGFIVSLMILPNSLSMFIHFDGEVVDDFDEYNITEAELLQWLDIIER